MVSKWYLKWMPNILNLFFVVFQVDYCHVSNLCKKLYYRGWIWSLIASGLSSTNNSPINRYHWVSVHFLGVFIRLWLDRGMLNLSSNKRGVSLIECPLIREFTIFWTIITPIPPSSANDDKWAVIYFWTFRILDLIWQKSCSEDLQVFLLRSAV